MEAENTFMQEEEQEIQKPLKDLEDKPKNDENDEKQSMISQQFSDSMSLLQLKQSISESHIETEKPTETDELTEKNFTLNKLDDQAQTATAEIPDVSLEFRTIFDISSKGKGWNLKIGDKEKVNKLSKKKIMILGFLGGYDVGKSHLCNILGNRQTRSGHQFRTPGLELFYPFEQDVYFGLIDVPGSHEAHMINDDELVQKLPAFDEKAGQKAEDDDENAEHKDFILRFNVLLSDSKIIHALKEKYIIEHCDIILLVTDKLSESDQITIYKNINYYKKYMDQNRQKTKYFYIVHNYKTLREVKDLEIQITKDIKSCFKVEEYPLFSFDAKPGVNNTLYKDQSGVSHLVLAADGSNAAKYYNDATIDFLKSKIRNNEAKATFDVKESFEKFCNRHLPVMLRQDVQIEFDESKSAFVNSKKGEIRLNEISWTTLGELVSGSFKPKYSITHDILEDGSDRYIIDVEGLDCTYVDKQKDQGSFMLGKPVRRGKGLWSLRIKGRKIVQKAELGTKSTQDAVSVAQEFVNHDREEGEFDILIPLTQDKICKGHEVDMKNGITRFIVRFAKEEEDF